MEFAFVIPAFQAEASVGQVVSDLVESTPPEHSAWVLVVDDGSTDRTAQAAKQAGAQVERHATNRGKGAALRTGFQRVVRHGAECCVAVDADGQHLATEAWRLALYEGPSDELVLGVRDLAAAGAPKLNRRSNRISNFFLNWFGGTVFRDTQCGLRRYPLERVLGSGAHADGYAYEAEVLLIAARRSWPVAELPIEVYYPPETERVTHFHNVRDPAKMMVTVLRTLARVPRTHDHRE